MEILELTALETAEMIKKGELTSMDAAEAVINAVEKKDGVYNCYTRSLLKKPKRRKSL